MIDESGLLLAPLVRRSLAPAGQTPILLQRARHRDKVSLTAALCLSPRRKRISLRFRTYPKQYVNNVRTADFLRALLREMRGPMIVIWDRGNMHRGDPIRELQRRFPRLQLESLPPYAPELNPIEQLWNHLKYSKLANYAPDDVYELNKTARQHLHYVKRKPKRMKSFFDAAGLPITV